MIIVQIIKQEYATLASIMAFGVSAILEHWGFGEKDLTSMLLR